MTCPTYKAGEQMSKGPGRQQRRILAALKKVPAFCLAELFGKYEEGGDKWVPATRSEKVSLYRAAVKLVAAGKVKTKRYNGGPDAWHVVVARRTFVFPARRGELQPKEQQGKYYDGKTPYTLACYKNGVKRQT